MSYTLTDLIPTLYTARDVVSRELVGMIPSVQIDAKGERAAINQVIRSFRTRPAAPQDIVPGTYVPSGHNKTLDSVDLAITKEKSELLPWTGNEQLSIESNFGVDLVLADDVAHAMRALTNLVEADLCALHKYASRMTGTPGTTPFATDLSDPAKALQILEDNGAPGSERQLIINTTSAAKLRSLGQVTKANEAGSTIFREQGILMNIDGFNIRGSGGFSNFTKGTGASYLVNNSGGYAVGDTTIAVDTGTGTILAGDSISFTGDTSNDGNPQKYLVSTALSAGSLTIAKPGLITTIADNTAVTVGNSYRPNLAFTRNAIALAVRKPAVPKQGDSAVDSIEIPDPRSGIVFELRLYKGYHQVTYEVGLAWGCAVTKPEHLALLAG